MLASAGRLMGRATSFRLLAGIMLFLLAAAVLPSVLNKKSPPGDAPATCDTAAEHRFGTSAGAAGAPTTMAVETAARRPAVMVSALSQPAAPPVVLPPPPDTPAKSSAGQTAELPAMSPWGGADHRCPQQAEAKTSPPDADPSQTARPVEYKADHRSP
jgi:hypothetical protein